MLSAHSMQAGSERMSVEPRGYDLAEKRFNVRPRGPVAQNPMVERFPEPVPPRSRRLRRVLRALLVCLLVAILGSLIFLGCPEPDAQPVAWSQALGALKGLDRNRADADALAALGSAITRIGDGPPKAGLVAAYALCKLDAGQTAEAERAFSYFTNRFPNSPYAAMRDAGSVADAWDREIEGIMRAVRIRAWRAETAAWCNRIRARLGL
jgi:hypothetical protein